MDRPSRSEEEDAVWSDVPRGSIPSRVRPVGPGSLSVTRIGRLGRRFVSWSQVVDFASFSGLPPPVWRVAATDQRPMRDVGPYASGGVRGGRTMVADCAGRRVPDVTIRTRRDCRRTGTPSSAGRWTFASTRATSAGLRSWRYAMVVDDGVIEKSERARALPR